MACTGHVHARHVRTVLPLESSGPGILRHNTDVIDNLSFSAAPLCPTSYVLL